MGWESIDRSRSQTHAQELLVGCLLGLAVLVAGLAVPTRAATAGRAGTTQRITPAGSPGTSDAAGPAPLPAAGPLGTYEASLGHAPLTYFPPGHLGHRWVGTAPYAVSTPVYSDGELIVDHQPFADTGASSSTSANEAVGGPAVAAGTLPGLCPVGSTSHYGTYTYPSATDLGDAADIVETRVAADPDYYYFLVVLQTVISPEDAVAGIGISPAGRTPVAGQGLGGFADQLQIAPGGATFNGRPVDSYIDIPGHTYEARVPRAWLPSGTWQVASAVGVWSAGTWSAVTDLGYDPREPLDGVANCWFEKQQSADIAAGTYPTFPVSTRRLDDHATTRAPIQYGLSIRDYYPAIHIGEGVIPQARYSQQSSANVYRGLLEDYAIYVPSSYRPGRPTPLVMLLHCLTCTNDVYMWSSMPGLRELAERLGAIVVTPLAYGEGGHYEGEAEWDVFDVLSDVSARYSIDRQRLYLAGMSMGSLGTFRLGLLYPQLWARTFGIGNYAEPECVSPTASPNYCDTVYGYPNYYGVLDNARDLPWELVNGAADELTPLPESVQYAQQFSSFGYGYRLYVLPDHDHDPALVGLTWDITSAWLQGARRIAHPQRITYTVESDMDEPTWNIRHDQAYWLSGIRLAYGATSGTVDATSSRGQTYTVTNGQGEGQDDAGPYAWLGEDPTWTSTGSDANAVSLTLTSIGAVAVDPAGALLDRCRPITLTVNTGGPATVTVIGVGSFAAPAGTSTDVLAPSC